MQDNQNNRFRGEALNQIYRVWLFRRFLPVLVIEVLILSLVLYWLAQAVFVERVFENAFRVFFESPPQILTFVVSAFAEAPLLTQFLTVGAAVLSALLLRQLTQGVLRMILVRKNYFGRMQS